MDETSVKKLAVIVIGGLLIFWVFKPKGQKDSGGGFFGGGSSRPKIRKPEISQDQLQDDTIRMAYESLCAYIDASNEGMSDTTLMSMKNDFKQEMGIEIYTDSNGKLAVKDVEGNDILVNA